MSLRPRPTHWFELRVPREQTVYALEALAGTGRVELDRDYVDMPLLDTRQLRTSIDHAADLIQRYAALLPVARTESRVLSDTPENTAETALAILRHWLAVHLRRTRRLRDRLAARRNLDLVRECITAMGDAAADLVDLGRPGPFLYKRLYACPRGGTAAGTLAEGGLVAVYPGPRHDFHAVLCLPEERNAYDGACHAGHCDSVALPDWLRAHWPQREARLQDALDRLATAIDSGQRELEQHRNDAAIDKALADLALLRWYLDHTVTLTDDHQRCHVTGWTTAETPQALQSALDGASIDATLLFRPPPPGRSSPVDMAQRGLASPFRIFVEMLGTPGSTELDPTPLLAVVVPVLFGFMFPDIGHGLVLAALGLALSGRFPALRFLVGCGLAAAGFGLLFGELFGSHAVVPALLFRPLDEPLLVLGAALGLGVLVILLGLALSGVEAYWRGRLRDWLWLDGAALVLYASGLVAVLYPPALYATAFALAWYLLGLVIVDRHRIGRGLARLVENTFELALNTLSFLRVGAFALAHAALSLALLELAGQVASPLLQLPLLLLGHALLIAIEGLIVFVQTTRLVLFEFFTRFLRADGRLFRPIDAAARP